ncbi:hypothetical protein HNR55_003441 [Acetobacter lovaniensis]|uniref:Uncharacterized protein n=1 Tax=Acetobacter lovaniensis TaxID=104100 RepID=A0A841QJP6_9PROT|nr:hypothetical protein [Acetobacter lovaniensis]
MAFNKTTSLKRRLSLSEGTFLLIVRQNDEVSVLLGESPGRFATQAGPRRHARHQTRVNADIPQFLLNLRPGTIAHVIVRPERYPGRPTWPVQTVAYAPYSFLAFD